MRPAGRRLPASARVILGLAATLLLTGCARTGLAEPVTAEGKKVESLYVVVYYIAVLIFLGVLGAILYAVVRFRKQPDDETLPPQTHGNTTAEVIWTALPLIIVLVLFAMSYGTLRVIDEAKPVKDLAAVVNVRGIQWGWEFDYGNDKVVSGGASDDEPPTLVLPVGEDVRLVMTSDNVIHAFHVPNFLFKRDIIPGRQNQFDIRVDIPGTYGGQCAEFCGTEHAKMTFRVRAVSRAEFDKFVEELTGDNCQGDESEPSAELALKSPNNQIKFVDVESEEQERCLKAPADTPVKIAYENGGGQPHNVAVVAGSPSNPKETYLGLPDAKVIESGRITYDVPPLPAGIYTYFCQVHPNMSGTYLVQ
ncbi:MAG TPA: cytochrome c oxidase subunit II [Mycobacteriales bacterium]|nr:cytochrome c oxidase subunit II [Mycobacteriales bacterium]